MSVFRVSLRKTSRIFNVTPNAPVKFSDPGLSTLLCKEVKEEFVAVIILASYVAQAGPELSV